MIWSAPPQALAPEDEWLRSPCRLRCKKQARLGAAMLASPSQSFGCAAPPACGSVDLRRCAPEPGVVCHPGSGPWARVSIRI